MTAGRDITIKSGECGRRKNMAKYVFGVDVGGTTVKMGLFTVEGELLDKWEIKTRTEDGGKNVLPECFCFFGIEDVSGFFKCFESIGKGRC